MIIYLINFLYIIDERKNKMKETIKINDFKLFYRIIKSLTMMSDGIKMCINENGLIILARNNYSKCEITSNSLTSINPVEICIMDIKSLLKLLTTLMGLYSEKELNSNVKLFFDKPFIKIESKKFKTKMITTDEEKIQNFIGTKVHSTIEPQLEFNTTTDIIKTINSHSFLVRDSNSARIYITTEKEMENNVIYATIGNDSNDLENSITLELGLITSGVIDDRRIILDFNRLNILNMINSDEIKVSIIKDKPVLMSSSKIIGENGSFLNIDLYTFMMVE